MSWAERSRRTGLSRSTVSTIVGRLVASQVEAALRPTHSGGGRLPIVFEVNEQCVHLLGVELGTSHIAAVRFSLRGKIIFVLSRLWSVQDDPDSTVDVPTQLLAGLLTLINPGTVVLGVSLTRAGEILLAPFREVLQARSISASLDGPQVLLSTLGDESIALCDATLMLQSALRQPELFTHRGRVSSPLNRAS